MLYYMALYEMTYIPYILYWNYISLILFFSLSLTLPVIRILLDFASQLTIRLVFLLFMQKKKISVATMI